MVFVLQYLLRMRSILRLFSRTAGIANTIPIGIAVNAAASGSVAGQNPVEALTKQHNWIFAGYMLLLILGLILTYLVWKSGGRVEYAIQADPPAQLAQS